MTETTAVGGVLAPIAKASGRIVTTFDRVAKVGWLAGLSILAPILVWTWPISAAGSLGVLVLTLVLALPGSVIYLVGRALASVARLPDSLLSQAGAIQAPALQLRGGLRSIWSVGSYLMQIRERLWAMRDELAAAGMLVRLASLPVLISILGSALAIGLMIPVAAVALLALGFTLL
jgi:hypothetical protein